MNVPKVTNINQRKENSMWWGVLGIISVIIFNSVYYYILTYFTNITNSYMYISSLNIFLTPAYDILSEIPTIVVPSLIAIITISFTIIVLSFNLKDKLPDEIIYKHIIYDKILITYLAIQSTFVIFLLSILFLNIYNLCWAYVFIINLIISVIITFRFFMWFINRTNKRGIYEQLEKQIDKNYFNKNKNSKKVNEEDTLNKFDKISNIKKIKLGNLYKLEFTKFNKTKVQQIIAKNLNENDEPKSLTTTNSEGTHYIHFIQKVGILKINKTKLMDFINKYNKSTHINYILFSPENNFHLRGDKIYEVVFCLENTDKIKELTRKLSEIFTLTDSKDIDEINDWFLCLNHSKTNDSLEIKNDFLFLKKILKKSMNSQFDLFKLILNRIEQTLTENLNNNELVVNETINLIYKLKESYIYEFSLALYLQNNFKNIIIIHSNTLNKKYSQSYEISILIISELIQYDFRYIFENEKDIKTLKNYKKVIINNIDCNHQIIKNTISNLFEDPINSEKYIITQMQQFIKTLDIYSEQPEEYDLEYYTFSKSKQKLIDEKCKIIKECHEYLRLRIADLSFNIIFLIENDEAPTHLKKLVFELMEYGEIYNSFGPPPDWYKPKKFRLNYEVNIPQPPYKKYILLYSFNQKLTDNETNKQNIFNKSEFKNNNFIEELNKTLDDLKFEYINKWFELNKTKFEQIKKELKSELVNIIKQHNESEINKIIEAKIDDELEKKFKTSIIKAWEDNALLRKLFKKNNNYDKKTTIEPKTNTKKILGFNLLFEKSYFIKNPTISWGTRTVGPDYGYNLARGEDNEILNNIISEKKFVEMRDNIDNSLNLLFKNFKDEENLKIFANTKNKDKISDSKYFIHESKIDNSDLKNIDMHRSFIGFYKYNKHKIPVYQLISLNILLVIDIKKIGKLVQYSPYEDINEELYVKVSELDEKDKKVLNISERPETKIIIKIFEKFRVEEINKNAFYGYNLKNEKTTK